MTAPPVRDSWTTFRDRMVMARWHVGVAGAVAVLAASFCLQPLLDGGWWVPRTLVMVAALCLTGLVVRVLGLPAPLHPLLQAGILLLGLTWMFAREQARWGVLPGAASMTRLRELVVQAVVYADATVPPAGVDLGLLMVIVAGIGLVALAVDTLAAALDLPGLTLIPLGALFVVPWVVNRGWAPTWAFVVVAVGWLWILASGQRDRALLWSPDARPGSRSLGFAVAAVTTAVAVLAGGLATLRGPTEPLDLGSGSGVGGSVKLDALVSLRRSLVTNDDRVVLTFATTVEQPDYLRLAVLEQFDGSQWRPAPNTELGPTPPPGPSGGVPGSGSGPLAEYRLDVGPLTGLTLPSPTGTLASANDWPVTWDQRTSLPMRADGSTVEGTRIGLVVAPPTWDASALRRASEVGDTAQVPAEDVADPTALVGDELPGLARELTASAGTPYDAALALQRWFTTEGGFTYSTAIEGGSDEDALAAFLDERVGYCEQFAATMALMARSVGIPARVVVGFTQGRADEGQWVVRGTDAHAWPELWMGAAGWVRFEPTPGAPTTTIPTYARAEEPSAAPSPTPSDSASEQQNRPTEEPAQVPDDTVATGPATSSASGLRWAWLLAALVALLLMAPAVVRARRRRRRARAGEGESSYREVVDTLVDLRLGAYAATPRATIASIRTALLATTAPVETDAALDRILRAVELQRYGARPTGGDAVRRGAQARTGVLLGVALAERTGSAAVDAARPAALAADVRTVRRALKRRAGWLRRLRATLMPPSVLADLTDLAGPRGSAEAAGPGSRPGRAG